MPANLSRDRLSPHVRKEEHPFSFNVLSPHVRKEEHPFSFNVLSPYGPKQEHPFSFNVEREPESAGGFRSPKNFVLRGPK